MSMRSCSLLLWSLSSKLDASFSYNLNEELTVFFQASNILNERDRSYSIYEERLLSYVNSGSKYSVGLRSKF